MKIITRQNITNTSFKGMWNNKLVLNGLEKVSEHSASFIAATSFIMSSGVRPLTIALTPNVEKENKQYAIANSIASGFVKFAFVEAIALPIENALKKTENHPDKFLKQNTINIFKSGSETLEKSKKFQFISQLMKQSIGFITAIPKSMLTVALIPVLMGKIFADNKNKEKNYSKYETPIYKEYSPIFSKSFKGGLSDTIAKGAGKLLDTKPLQKAAEKFNSHDTDIARNMAIATDILLTGSFAHQTMQNKNIKEEQKKFLIMNSVYATGATIAGGCAIDKAIKKGTENFTDKFTEINKNNPKLAKYIEGINVIRPTLIFAGIYYGILPVLTTYLADKSAYKKHT